MILLAAPNMAAETESMRRRYTTLKKTEGAADLEHDQDAVLHVVASRLWVIIGLHHGVELPGHVRHGPLVDLVGILDRRVPEGGNPMVKVVVLGLDLDNGARLSRREAVHVEIPVEVDAGQAKKLSHLKALAPGRGVHG